MLNRSASLAMSTRVLKALPGKLDIERHSPNIFFFYFCRPYQLKQHKVIKDDIDSTYGKNLILKHYPWIKKKEIFLA